MASHKRKNEKPKPQPVNPKRAKVTVTKPEGRRFKKPASPVPRIVELGTDESDEEIEDEGGSEITSDTDMGEAKNPPKAEGKTLPTTSKSKESHAEQKRLAAERKQSKPHGEIITRGKRIWERLRRTKLAAEERKKLIEEFETLIDGRVSDLVFKHDASRIVQSALKYGDKEIKAKIAAELKNTFAALAQSSYGKYLVVKILHYGTPETREMVVQELYGNVRKLVKHREAALVVEDVFREYATPEQKAALLREFYGVEFTIFRDASDKSSLRDILEKMPEKRVVVMKSLFEQIEGVIKKGATTFTILHKAISEYLLNVKPGTTEATEMIELVKDHVADMAFTKDGAQVVIRCMALGTAKDRKAMIKALKQESTSLARHEHGHLILLSIFETVDDTVLVAKSLLPELQKTLPDLACDKYARIPLLYPFCDRLPRIVPKQTLSLLQEITHLRQSTSKKDPTLRQTELATIFSKPFLACIKEHSQTLITNSFGCQFATEVLLSSRTTTTTNDDKSPALTALATAATATTDPTDPAHISHSPSASRMLKALITGGHYCPETKSANPTSPPLSFHTTFYPLIKPYSTSWATGPGSFVIVALLETNDFDATQLKLDLSNSKPKLRTAAASGNKGTRVILEILERK